MRLSLKLHSEYQEQKFFNERTMPDDFLNALKMDFPVGTRCNLLLGNDRFPSTIVGYNEHGGLYSPMRYPLIIERDFDHEIYEYCLHNVIDVRK